MKTKIQCNAYDAVEANVLCADEAVLCWICDEKIHAANKLSRMHQRVPLSSSLSRMPKCDIYQETIGYFFCLEDQALLCSKCDVPIHTANSYVSAHQRFLLTGVEVGLEASEPGGSSAKKLNSIEKVALPRLMSKSGAMVPLTVQTNEAVSGHVGEVGNSVTSKVPFAGGTTPGGIPEWHVHELLGSTDLNHNYMFTDNGSSKADNGDVGESEWLRIILATEDKMHNSERSGNASDACWTVPDILSPPTASSLHLPKQMDKTIFNTALFIPDIGFSGTQIYINNS